MKILIAGDSVPRNRLKPLIESGKYNDIFGEVKPIIEQADYAIVNFESPVCNSDYKPIEKCGPNLKCSTKAVEAVKWAGFKMTSLANNHILDYGAEGLQDTMQVCKEFGIDIVGVGENLYEASKTFYKHIQGQKLAIVNCCEHEFSIATETTPGANPLNPVRQFYQIQEARKNADYVLVIVHGGHEHFQLPSLRMKETYRFFIDAGADAVVNHHQHCYSGYETYNGKPIFYGIGNFCFDRVDTLNNIWNEGYIVTLDFCEKAISFATTPYIQCNESPNVRMMTETGKKQFEETINRLNKIISDDKLLMAEQNRFMDSTSKGFLVCFEPYQNRYLRTLYTRGFLPSLLSTSKRLLIQNYLVCESHYDRLKNAIKQH